MNIVVLKNTNQTFYYRTKRTDIQNALGKVSATLTEYLIGSNKDEIICWLYKTKEGYWYDRLDLQKIIDNKTKQEIKAAIDVLEKRV